MNSSRIKPNIDSYIIGLYLFFTPLFLTNESRLLILFPSLFTIILLIKILSKRYISGNNKALNSYFLFVVWCGVSHIWIGNLSYNFGGFAFLVLTLLSCFAITKTKIKKIDLTNILFIFCLSMIPAIYFNYESLIKISTFNSTTSIRRFSGTFGNSNSAAIYSISVIWSSLFLLTTSKISRTKQVILLIIALISFQVIIISGSRKGFIALFILFVFQYFYLIKYLAKNIFIKILNITLLTISAYYIFKYISSTIFYSRLEGLINGDKESYSDRAEILLESLDTWLNNPLLGVGFDSSRLYSSHNMPSHSSVMETLASTGIIGFILYFSIFLFLGISCFRIYKFSKKYKFIELKKEVSYLIIFLGFFLFFNFFAILYNSRLLWPFIFIVFSYLIQKKNLTSLIK